MNDGFDLANLTRYGLNVGARSNKNSSRPLHCIHSQ